MACTTTVPGSIQTPFTPDTEQAQDAAKACVIPLPTFRLDVQRSPKTGADFLTSGPATVLAARVVGPDEQEWWADWDWRIELRIPQDPPVYVTVRVQLPGTPDLPLRAGDEVILEARGHEPFWSDWTLAIRKDEQLLLYARDGKGSLPGDVYPQADMGDVRCSIDESCGTTQYPDIGLQLGADSPLATLASGETTTWNQLTAGAGISKRFVDWGCTDSPGWMLQAWAYGPPPCDTSKLPLTTANPEHYELIEICITPGSEVEILAVAPTLTCPSGGAFAQCEPGQVPCLGALDHGPDGTVPSHAWRTLCSLSRLPGVLKIAGGHYL